MSISKDPIRILELYSGIGGMHMAFSATGIPGKIITSVDINTIANIVYQHNFPTIDLLNRNIQSLTAEFVNGLKVNTILMSPPCQPFTRNGLKRDTEDARSCSFTHVLNILPGINIDNILIENVKGFEVSEMQKVLTKALNKAGFVYQEFILSPTQFGVPNTRHRYYCIARKRDFNFIVENSKPMTTFPVENDYCNDSILDDIIEKDVDTNKYLLPDSILNKRANILDIVHFTSSRSCCFTKSYGRYVEGTGSVLSSKKEEDVENVFKKLESLEKNTSDYLACVKQLELRYFTPREVCRLMSIPETFSFPSNISKKQRYNLLGNSINVKVVSELIKILLT